MSFAREKASSASNVCELCEFSPIGANNVLNYSQWFCIIMLKLFRL